MTHLQLLFSSVEFSYSSSSGPLFTGLSFELRSGWTGVVGDNGAGKTSLLALAVGDLTPVSGAISRPGSCLYCAQRTEDLPEELEDFLYSGDNAALGLAAKLGIDFSWPARWETLSHGERKRAQIGLALWRAPELLALDEPTNHLDEAGKACLSDCLKSYRGVGLVVSHDQDFLDSLAERCLFIRDGETRLRPGNLSRALAEEDRESLESRRRRECAAQELSRLRTEADKRARLAQNAASRVSKRRLDPKDHDAKRKLDIARVSGKDATGGKLLNQIGARVERAERAYQDAGRGGERKTGVRVAGERARGDFLARLDAGEIALGDTRKLRHPELSLSGQSRVALTGPNGSGKSSLIGILLARLKPGEVLSLPQELGRREGARIRAEILAEEEERKGEILARLSRLGSDPVAVTQSPCPSPGETRKLILARGILEGPSIIVLDEPTNHLDLRSIRLLKEALMEFTGALLIVSHDRAFLHSLVTEEWKLIPGADGDSVLKVTS